MPGDSEPGVGGPPFSGTSVTLGGQCPVRPLLNQRVSQAGVRCSQCHLFMHHPSPLTSMKEGPASAHPTRGTQLPVPVRLCRAVQEQNSGSVQPLPPATAARGLRGKVGAEHSSLSLGWAGGPGLRARGTDPGLPAGRSLSLVVSWLPGSGRFVPL